MLIWFLFLAVIAVIAFMLMRRRDYGKPKECEATIVKKQVGSAGGAPVYTYTLECKGAGTKVLSTREGYYAKLEEGMTGMLAFKGKTLLDFEPFKKH